MSSEALRKQYLYAQCLPVALSGCLQASWQPASLVVSSHNLTGFSKFGKILFGLSLNEEINTLTHTGVFNLNSFVTLQLYTELHDYNATWLG